MAFLVLSVWSLEKILDMATTAMLSTAFLVVVLVMMEAVSVALASKASVNIFDDIEGSSGPIQVDCSEETDHMAPHSLAYGQKFGWGFAPSVTWYKTKYYCQFAWGIKIQTVRVWFDHGPCNHVEWHVRADGFWRVCPDSEFGDAPVLVSIWH